MLKLSMTSLRGNQIPAILPQSIENLADFHEATYPSRSENPRTGERYESTIGYEWTNGSGPLSNCLAHLIRFRRETADRAFYAPPSFVVRHAITAAAKSMSEARMNGAPGSSRGMLAAESARMK